MRKAQLTDCPVCHSAITGAEASCASCATELTPYRELLLLANSLMLDAINSVLRGETGKALELGKRAIQVSPLLTEQNSFLLARIALDERRYAEAVKHILALPETNEYRDSLLLESRLLQEAEARGKEHFNLALRSARKGMLEDAAYHARIALEKAPYEAAVWRLSLKIALKRGDFSLAEAYLETAASRFPEDLYIAGLWKELQSSG